MSDREQTRRDAEAVLHWADHHEAAQALAEDCVSLLAELEQAERQADCYMNMALDEGRRADDTQRDLEQAEQERDGAQLALESNAPLILDLEARLVKADALVEALRRIRDGFDGDEFQDSADAYDQHRDIAREALAVYEQEQKPRRMVDIVRERFPDADPAEQEQKP